jgi:putative sigma-54 modulation protein
MEVTVVGRNIVITDALRAYAEKKVDKLQKYFEREIVDAQVTMSVERSIHTADVTIQVDGLLLRGEERTGDMYASIDSAVDKIERQIRKYKTRINRKLRQDGNKLVESAVNRQAPQTVFHLDSNKLAVKINFIVVHAQLNDAVSPLNTASLPGYPRR